VGTGCFPGVKMVNFTFTFTRSNTGRGLNGKDARLYAFIWCRGHR
jgi:hypothetical protein